MGSGATPPHAVTRKQLRVCSVPGCPELTASSRCREHTAKQRATQDAKRGNWRQRGYDPEYDRNRLTVIREETHCWICNQLVDKTLPGTHRDGPTADHVIRKEDGGTNKRDNLRLAHLRCNSGRTRKQQQQQTPGVPPLAQLP